MHRPLVGDLEVALLGILAIALMCRFAIAAYRLKKEDREIVRRIVERWRTRPGWLTSNLLLVLLALAILFLGARGARELHRWHAVQRALFEQKSLLLDLHIPNASPNRTYTVTAKFYVQDRPYVSSTPLQIRFGARQTAYRVRLYYDAGDPARNAWTPLPPPKRELPIHAMAAGIGLLLLALAWVELAEVRWIRRRLCKQEPGAADTRLI